jgi:ankyrin repeat protein
MKHAHALRLRNIQGPFGNTLLHSAVVSGDVAEVERLLKLGANPNVANRDGRTPLHAAALFGFKKIYALLRQFGASSPCPDPT